MPSRMSQTRRAVQFPGFRKSMSSPCHRSIALPPNPNTARLNDDSSSTNLAIISKGSVSMIFENHSSGSYLRESLIRPNDARADLPATPCLTVCSSSFSSNRLNRSIDPAGHFVQIILGITESGAPVSIRNSYFLRDPAIQKRQKIRFVWISKVWMASTPSSR